MRMLGAGIGLLSLLIVVGIMLYLFAGPTGPGGASYGRTLATKNQEMTQQANQFSGRDERGRPLRETLTLAPSPESGPMRGVLVETIEADGIAATHFGLQAGDEITQIGPQEVGGFIITDADAAATFLEEAFARGQTIRVHREGEVLTLPK